MSICFVVCIARARRKIVSFLLLRFIFLFSKNQNALHRYILFILLMFMLVFICFSAKNAQKHRACGDIRFDVIYHITTTTTTNHQPSTINIIITMFKLPRYFHYYDNNNDLTKVRLEKVEISWNKYIVEWWCSLHAHRIKCKQNILFCNWNRKLNLANKSKYKPNIGLQKRLLFKWFHDQTSHRISSGIMPWAPLFSISISLSWCLSSKFQKCPTFTVTVEMIDLWIGQLYVKSSVFVEKNSNADKTHCMDTIIESL